MKLEREPVFGHITLNHKPDPKPFDYDELSLDSNGIKSGKVAKETQNGHSPEFNDDQNGGGRFYLVNDSNDGIAETKLDCFKSTENVKPHKVYQAEESDICTDKSAVECEMPELQVCYRDSSYSSVKDICVDEGVHSRDKLLFEDNADKKILCTFVFPDQELDKELDKEEIGIGIFSPKGLKSSAENESNTGLLSESKDLVPTDQEVCDTKDEIGNDILRETIFPEDVVLTKEMEAENPRFESPAQDENAVPQVQISSDDVFETAQAVNSNSDLAAEKIDNNNDDESSVVEEPKISSDANELSYSSTVEKRRITFDFSPMTPVTIDNNGPQTSVSERLEEPENKIHVTDDTIGMMSNDQTSTCESNETPNTVASEKTRDESETTSISEAVESPKTSSSTIDDDISEGLNTSTQLAKEDSPRNSNATTQHKISEDGLSNAHSASNHFQFGESSFSAAGPLSGRINYLGPVPYSGSISVRSDSSTTSTRSFAFPILQNEWNSSPVRMAKADRRHFRKHRGWRQGILCCRF